MGFWPKLVSVTPKNWFCNSYFCTLGLDILHMHLPYTTLKFLSLRISAEWMCPPTTTNFSFGCYSDTWITVFLSFCLQTTLEYDIASYIINKILVLLHFIQLSSLHLFTALILSIVQVSYLMLKSFTCIDPCVLVS